MELASLVERKGNLEASLKNIEQSFHILTGHLAEVNYQITELAKVDSQKSEDETQVECGEAPVVE